MQEWGRAARLRPAVCDCSLMGVGVDSFGTRGGLAGGNTMFSIIGLGLAGAAAAGVGVVWQTSPGPAWAAAGLTAVVAFLACAGGQGRAGFMLKVFSRRAVGTAIAIALFWAYNLAPAWPPGTLIPLLCFGLLFGRVCAGLKVTGRVWVGGLIVAFAFFVLLGVTSATDSIGEFWLVILPLAAIAAAHQQIAPFLRRFTSRRPVQLLVAVAVVVLVSGHTLPPEAGASGPVAMIVGVFCGRWFLTPPEADQDRRQLSEVEGASTLPGAD